MIISVGKAINRHEDNVLVTVDNETALELVKQKILAMDAREFAHSLNCTLSDLIEAQIAEIGYKRQLKMAQYIAQELQEIKIQKKAEE